MDSNKQIKLGAILSYIAIAFNILTGIIYTPWMISVIGQSDYGIYGVAISVISLCTMDFGLGSASSRFIAKYLAEKDEKSVERFIGIAVKLYLVIDAAIILALSTIYFLLDRIYISFSPMELDKLRVIFVITGAFTVISFPFQILNGVLIARERFVFQKLCDCINKVLIVVLMVGALNLGGGLYSLVIVNAVVGCIIIILKNYYLKKKKIIKVEWKYWNIQWVKNIFSFSVWITIILIMQRLILNITPTILGVTSGTTEIAVFTAAMNIEGYTYTLTGALSGLFLARVSMMIYGENADKKKLEELMVKVGRIQLIAIGAICAIFFSVGQEFVLLWLGNDFKNVYYVVVLLIAPQLVISTQGIAETALTAMGEVKYRTIAVTVTALVSVVLSFILSRSLGAIGASIGIFTGYVLGDVIVLNIIYKKTLKIDIGTFFRKCHLNMSIPIILTFLTGLVIRQIAYGKGWLYFMLKCAFLGILYLTAIWTISLKREEKTMILGQLRRQN